jgi:hypothetical protein
LARHQLEEPLNFHQSRRYVMNEQPVPQEENSESNLDKLRQLSDTIDKETLRQLKGTELDQYALLQVTAANLRISETKYEKPRNLDEGPQEVTVYKGVRSRVTNHENRQPLLAQTRQKGIRYGEAIRENALHCEKWSEYLINEVSRQVSKTDSGETPFISATKEKKSAEEFGDEVVSFIVPQVSVVPVVEWLDNRILNKEALSSGGMSYMGIAKENESLILVDYIPAERHTHVGPSKRTLARQQAAASPPPPPIEQVAPEPLVKEKLTRWKKFKITIHNAFFGS